MGKRAELAAALANDNVPRAIARDRGRCVLCGQPAAHVHHIMFRSHFGVKRLPDLWSPGNMCLLCLGCHRRAHGPESRAVREELLGRMRG